MLTITAFRALLSAVSAAFVLAAAAILASIYGVPVTGITGLAATGGSRPAGCGRAGRRRLLRRPADRHTAAAIGVLLGYLFVWFVRNVFLGEQAWSQRLTPLAPEANIAAIVHKVSVYEVPVRTLTTDGLNVDFVEHTVSLTHGLLYWAVLLLVVVGATWLVFRRRDVT